MHEEQRPVVLSAAATATAVQPAKERDRKQYHLAYSAGLDGLRGVAVLLVCFCHYAENLRGSSLVENLVLRLAQSGWIGVDLFFAISGYLITSILLNTREGPGYLRNFFARRTLRIFPLYYAALALYFCFLRPLEGSEDVPIGAPWLLGYATNVFVALHGWPSRFVGHFWSLAVEEQFYLAWPFCVLALKPAHLLRLCAILWGSAILLRFAMYTLTTTPDPVVLYVLLPLRFDPIVAGALLAILVHRRRGDGLPVRWSTSLLIVSGVVLAIFAIDNRGFFYWEWAGARQAVSYALLATACASAVALSAGSRDNWLSKQLSRSVPVAFGKYSYAIYIFHLWLDTLARRSGMHPAEYHLESGTILIFYSLYAVIQLALVMALARATFELLEKHALALKRYFV